MKLYVVLFFSIAICIAREDSGGQFQAENDLIKLLAENGGHFDVGVRSINGIRGLVASKDLADEEILLKLPLSYAIIRTEKELGYSSEFAYGLTKQVYLDPEFNKTHGLFWSVHPSPGEVLCGEVLTSEELNMLQMPTLKDFVIVYQEITRDIYYGNFSYFDRPSLPGVMGDNVISLDTFRDGDYLLPIADLANHDEDPNARRHEKGDFVYMTATRPIKKGEEITNSYQEAILHRNDMSLTLYGFVTKSDPPVLCALDLPTYNASEAFSSTPENDSVFYGSGGSHNTPEELDRLQRLLKEMATTEEEDIALLKDRVLSWRAETLVKFRLQRKQALRHAISSIKMALMQSEKTEL